MAHRSGIIVVTLLVHESLSSWCPANFRHANQANSNEMRIGPPSMIKRGVRHHARSKHWFPPNADAAALKRRFRELASEFHPDIVAHSAAVDANDDGVAEFQALSAEYQRRLAACKTDEQREMLRRGWTAVGGMTAAVASAATEPAFAMALAQTLGSMVLVSFLIDILVPVDDEAIERGDAADHTPVPQLYVELDAAVERAACAPARDLITHEV